MSLTLEQARERKRQVEGQYSYLLEQESLTDRQLSAAAASGNVAEHVRLRKALDAIRLEQSVTLDPVPELDKIIKQGEAEQKKQHAAKLAARTAQLRDAARKFDDALTAFLQARSDLIAEIDNTWAAARAAGFTNANDFYVPLRTLLDEVVVKPIIPWDRSRSLRLGEGHPGLANGFADNAQAYISLLETV